MPFFSVFASLLFAAVLPPSQTAGVSLGDESPLRTLVSQQADAWNRGDGTAWAVPFAPDAEFINIRGQIFHGHDAVAKLHQMLFASVFMGTHTEATIRHITFLSPEIALVAVDLHVTGLRTLMPGVQPTSPGALSTYMTYLATRPSASGPWQFTYGQNTAVLPGVPPPAAR